MPHQNFPSYTVAAPGQTVTTTVSTATAAALLPNTSAGTRPRFVRFAVTQPTFVTLGVAAVAATNTSMLVKPNAPEIMAVGSRTHWSAIDNGVASLVNVTPLEDS
jgi:hypothetical protein